MLPSSSLPDPDCGRPPAPRRHAPGRMRRSTSRRPRPASANVTAGRNTHNNVTEKGVDNHTGLTQVVYNIHWARAPSDVALPGALGLCLPVRGVVLSWLPRRMQVTAASESAPAVSAVVSARLCERNPSTPPPPPPRRISSPDRPTPPSSSFFRTALLPLIAACPERLLLHARAQVRRSLLAFRTTSLPAVQTFQLPKVRSLS